jgi:hypothetical protein
MKIVSLAAPAVIHGAVRYPVEGAIPVTDEKAKALKAEGKLDGDPEDVPEADAAEDKPAGSRRGRQEA